jgi:hypothetical protein
MITKIHQYSGSANQSGSSSCPATDWSSCREEVVVAATVAVEVVDVVVNEVVVEVLVLVTVEPVVEVEVVEVREVELVVDDVVVDEVLEEVVVVVVEIMQLDSPWAMVNICMGAKAPRYVNEMGVADWLMSNSMPAMSLWVFSVWLLLGYRLPTLMYWPSNGAPHSSSA